MVVPMLRLFMWGSLLLAFLYGQLADVPSYESLLSKRYPAANTIELVSASDPYSVYTLTTKEPREVIVTTGNGYGGKLSVANTINRGVDKTTIDGVSLIQDIETKAYVERLKKKFFFRQFTNKNLTDDFVLGRDIDSYSGATVTAKAITGSVRLGAHGYATEVLGLTPSWQPPDTVFGLGEFAMLAIVLIALLTSFRFKHSVITYLKVGLPFASLLIVGFYTNASISIGSLSSIALGYLPGIRSHPIWWMMMGTVLIGIALLGKNLYCDRLCPFSTVQSILNNISGIKWKVPKVVAKNSRKAIWGMIWIGMMLIFISKHPSVGSYEPFSLMFSLEGSGFQWYILPLALFGSIFVPEFWCRLFCPVGLTLNEAVKVRRKVINKLSIKVKNV